MSTELDIAVAKSKRLPPQTTRSHLYLASPYPQRYQRALLRLRGRLARSMCHKCMQLCRRVFGCSPKILINEAAFENDIGPFGLWRLSPGAPVSQAVSCTVWSKTAMSNCPCECIFSISLALLKKYGENKKAAICVESSFQAPSFVPAIAVDPNNAPVNKTFFLNG